MKCHLNDGRLGDQRLPRGEKKGPRTNRPKPRDFVNRTKLVLEVASASELSADLSAVTLKDGQATGDAFAVRHRNAVVEVNVEDHNVDLTELRAEDVFASALRVAVAKVYVSDVASAVVVEKRVVRFELSDRLTAVLNAVIGDDHHGAVTGAGITVGLIEYFHSIGAVLGVAIETIGHCGAGESKS